MSILRALSSGPRGADPAALARVERKLDLLLNHSGLADAPLPAAVMTTQLLPSPDVEALLRQGKKIHAIKLYRQQTGMGLKDAKDAVEAMERQSR